MTFNLSICFKVQFFFKKKEEVNRNVTEIYRFGHVGPCCVEQACELFILELTWRAWSNAEDNKRRTLQKDDVSAAINSVEVFDFLVDGVPQPESKSNVNYTNAEVDSGVGVLP